MFGLRWSDLYPFGLELYQNCTNKYTASMLLIYPCTILDPKSNGVRLPPSAPYVSRFSAYEVLFICRIIYMKKTHKSFGRKKTMTGASVAMLPLIPYEAHHPISNMIEN
jgi:hypothetical protein